MSAAFFVQIFQPINTVILLFFLDGGISMGKTDYQIIVFYDGNKTAREIMTEVIVRKVRKACF